VLSVVDEFITVSVDRGALLDVSVLACLVFSRRRKEAVSSVVAVLG